MDFKKFSCEFRPCGDVIDRVRFIAVLGEVGAKADDMNVVATGCRRHGVG